MGRDLNDDIGFWQIDGRVSHARNEDREYSGIVLELIENHHSLGLWRSTADQWTVEFLGIMLMIAVELS